MVSIYLAHRDWDWATKQASYGGRAALPQARYAVFVRPTLNFAVRIVLESSEIIGRCIS